MLAVRGLLVSMDGGKALAQEQKTYGIPTNRSLPRKRPLSSKIDVDTSTVPKDLLRASRSLLHTHSLASGTSWVLMHIRK